MTSPPPFPLPTPDQINHLRAYIQDTWRVLTRSQVHLLAAAQDPKVEYHPQRPWIIYISQRENFQQVQASLAQSLTAAELSQIDLKILPAEIDNLQEHGLLYLPQEYVVPGGRFNELYGWDSYFIVLGLLRDGEYALAHSMVALLIYEIEHYGTVLNGNRTYMLNRSHPPLLTPMIRAVFRARPDLEWLHSLLPAVERYYSYWTVPPHLNPATGLSHYHALGHGPAPEVLASEKDDQGQTHYDRVRAYYQQHPVTAYDVRLYYDAEADKLTDLFYQGDRSMRESGFDISDRFGPFSVDIIHYAPVCLNSLLYQMEQDIAWMHRQVKHLDQVAYWEDQGSRRQHLVNQFLWDEAAGQYFDYNFRSGHRRPYKFATTFMPLWAGLASQAQAQRVAQNLVHFEAPGGLLTSTHVSGNQWDAPFGWAPLQFFAVQGLTRYGYHPEAHRLAAKFVHLVSAEFGRTGNIFEKYDVERCSAQVSDEILFGYSSNEIGFGWTNGVILEFLALLGLFEAKDPDPVALQRHQGGSETKDQ
ncbi:trehalase family glycosidase [Lyngbya confervoides]|uniref:Alpha,alpha-trehalase n=1 Tax=Lyngbya confervoides BDU141951 TaxID=1574623 RepID=A0ABD4T1K7_9CYAN|nr:trehalase family glycosidase [Lyngbya confervoides]MCM1982592.1 alpha,alpha-trehalase [Lyngbya confervoides BDU141951]